MHDTFYVTLHRHVVLSTFSRISLSPAKWCVILESFFSHHCNIIQPVEPGAPPKFTLREDRIPGTTESWKAWCEGREVDEWVQSVAGVLDQGWNEQ